MASVTFTKNEQLAILGLGVAAILLAPKIGNFLGKQAVVTVLDTGAGVVTQTGKAIGIPETDRDQCQADIAAGRTWDASFSCDAATFMKYVFG